MNRHDQLRTAESSAIAPARRGLTLIELLVTIVIMVTVLAGALPLLSPNNNSRKIREASRQLTTLLSQAQAQAARDGRPVGVAFREFSNGTSRSGVALEAYMIAEPPPFTGFSEYSRVTVMDDPDGLTYGPPGTDNPQGNDGTLYAAKLRGKPLRNLQFSLYGQVDPIPPRMVRVGDVVNVQGNLFIVVDDIDPDSKPNQIDPATGYFISTVELRAVWLNQNGQQLSPGAKPYSFRRLPVNTSEQPLQLPRGIAIDLEGSGPDGIAGLGVDDDFDEGGVADVVGIMFSPNGSLSDVYLNGRSLPGVSQVNLLAGLAENGNGNALDRNDYDFAGNPPATAAEITARRSRVNWLNPDSRWICVNRAGRIITADNNISYDPSDPAFHENKSAAEQRVKQINAARNAARTMTATTGR